MVEETWEQEGEEGTKEFVEEVSEAAEYSPKSDFSKAQIVYAQIERCCSIRSEEMRSGYSTHVVDKIGNIKLVHVPDSRKKYIGAVDALMNLLSPEIKRNRKTKEEDEEYIEEFKKEREDIQNKYLYAEKEIKMIDGNHKLVSTGRKYIPEIGDILLAGMKAIGKGVMGENRIEGYWDSKVNAYYNEVLELYDLLFADLFCLFDEFNYFKQSMSF